jgi:hypothetical protein
MAQRKPRRVERTGSVDDSLGLVPLIVENNGILKDFIAITFSCRVESVKFMQSI